MKSNNRIWKKLYYQSGRLKYEGFVSDDNKPEGAGTMYYPDGKIYKEGIFNYKGLICGTEFYSNGNKRFSGLYHCNDGYGPHYPLYGEFFYEDGRHCYSGEIHYKFHGSLWWPEVVFPVWYGKVNLPGAPNYDFYDGNAAKL